MWLCSYLGQRAVLLVEVATPLTGPGSRFGFEGSEKGKLEIDTNYSATNAIIRFRDKTLTQAFRGTCLL